MENLGRRRFNVEQIHERGLSKQHTVKVKKIPGVTTETILEKLENLLESKPGMLIVHAGTNHCVKSVQMRSFSVPYFPIVQIWENTDQKNSVFGHFSRSE